MVICLSSPISLLMKKLLVSTTIIALILANGITTYQYKKDIEDYERKLKFQSDISMSRQTMIDEKNAKIDVLREVISENKKQIKDNKSQISNLKQQLEKAKKDGESPSVSISRGESANYKSFYVDGTAYTSDCLGCSGITYSEYNVRDTINYGKYRIVATDLEVIPLYSLLKVQTRDEIFYAIVLDKGGGINGYEMDLLVNSYQDAVAFGRQKVKVTILRKGK